MGVAEGRGRGERKEKLGSEAKTFRMYLLFLAFFSAMKTAMKSCITSKLDKTFLSVYKIDKGYRNDYYKIGPIL